MSFRLLGSFTSGSGVAVLICFAVAAVCLIVTLLAAYRSVVVRTHR